MVSQTPRHARRGIVAAVSAIIKWLRDARISVYGVVSCVSVTVLTLLLGFLFFRPTVVYGSSMFPTLSSNDIVLLNGADHEFSYGDIAVIRRSNGELLIKRVIALGGDTVYINAEDGFVYRNGELLHEPYLVSQTPTGQLAGAVIVPQNHIFVLGDNRTNSFDSRYRDVGMISLDAVIGKAVYRLYPFETAGSLLTEE